jgi:hypothetical protein
MTFWRPGKGNAQHFQGRQNVAEKNRTKAVGRLWFFVARAAYRRRSIYRPVMCSTGVYNYIIIVIP